MYVILLLYTNVILIKFIINKIKKFIEMKFELF